LDIVDFLYKLIYAPNQNFKKFIYASFLKAQLRFGSFLYYFVDIFTKLSTIDLIFKFIVKGLIQRV